MFKRLTERPTLGDIVLYIFFWPIYFVVAYWRND